MAWTGKVIDITNPSEIMGIAVANIEKVMGVTSTIASSASFIFEVRTTVSDETFTLPFYSGGTYDFEIDWDDTTSDTITAYNQEEITHTYTAAGTYIIEINGTCESWYFNNSASAPKIYDISNWGNLKFGTESRNFYGCSNLTITATDILDTSNDTDMTAMFSLCGDLTTVPNMNDWNTSSVTTFNNTFRNATNFNQDISGWDSSSVEDIQYMFYFATAFDQDISGWDVSNVTTFDSTFRNATAFDQDISSWVPSAALYMQSMFNTATSFNQDISGWDVSNVTNMYGMFWGATSFDQNINWDVSNVTKMTFMFYNATAFNGDISSWVPSAAIDMDGMFAGATTFNQNISSWDTSSVEDMNYMFNGAIAFNQNISSWDTSSVTTMYEMFYGAISFDQDISSWDVSNVTAMTSMFTGVTLSTANYSAILISWEGQSVQNDVTFDAGNSKYSSGAAATARQALIDDHTWTISDGGQE